MNQYPSNNPYSQYQQQPDGQQYPYAQPQLQFTQPPPPIRPRRKLGRGCMISLIVVAALLVFGIIEAIATGGNGIGNGNASTQPTQSSQQPTTQTDAPTDTPIPTTAPAGIADGSAVLGGTIMAFDNKIGSNNCCQDNGWEDGNTHVLVYTAQDGGRWYQKVGEQSSERVTGVLLQLFESGTWSTIQDAQKAIAPYMPSDAHLIKSLGNGEYEYESNLLAQTLPASDFVDANNHPEQPGLFFAYYDAPGNNQVDYCEIATDRGFQNEVSLPPQA